MYAIIQIAHHQYLVEPGKEYEVDKFLAEPGSKMQLDALLYADDKGVNFTDKKPRSVEIEVLSQDKGEKIETFVYKAKSRYRRRSGFRKQVTKFKVVSIK